MFTFTKKGLLKSANTTLYDLITNIIHLRIQFRAKQKRISAKKKNVLRTLANSRANTPKKKKHLIQHVGGILKTILGMVLNALALL